MKRIDTCFQALKAKGKKALIPYVVAGDPSISLTLDMMNQLVEKGADILELGMPFSDPMADGPVIQAAHNRALKNHVSLKDVFDLVKKFRANNQRTPIVLMTYLNPIEVMGYDNFLNQAIRAGIDGVLIVDMPPEEGEALFPVMQAKGVAPIFLISPTTTKERLTHIAAHARGYLYYVSLKGVTGSKTLDVSSVTAKLKDIRAVTDLPLAVGFGISDGQTAQKMAQVADGVIVGSAYVKRIAACGLDKAKISFELALLTEELRSGIDSVVSGEIIP